MLFRSAPAVSLNTPVTFEFDEEMDVTTPLDEGNPPLVVANHQFQPATAAFKGRWAADKHTLVFEPVAPLPVGTVITWSLNPFGATAPLKSAQGKVLQPVSGSFKAVTPASSPCDDPGETGARLSVLNSVQYVQNSATGIVPNPTSPAAFSLSLEAPLLARGSAGRVTNLLIVLPGGASMSYSNLPGGVQITRPFSTESALESAFPRGDYVIRMLPIGMPELDVPITLPPAPGAPPAISNFTEAQSIVFDQDFTLRWTPFQTQDPGAFIDLVITDAVLGPRGSSSGTTNVFQATTGCSPPGLPPTATSVVIPANTLVVGRTSYQGVLRFGFLGRHSTNAMPQILETAQVEYTTTFSIRAVPTPVITTPTVIKAARLLDNGHPELTVTGAPGSSVGIFRATTLPGNWLLISTFSLNASGETVYEDPTLGLVLPQFYKVGPATPPR